MSGPGSIRPSANCRYRRLGDVALARARDFGVTHADFRFERNRYQYLGGP